MCLKLTHAQGNTLKRSTSKKKKVKSGKQVPKLSLKSRALPVLNSASDLQIGSLNKETLRTLTEFMREEGLSQFSFKGKDFELELKMGAGDLGFSPMGFAPVKNSQGFQAASPMFNENPSEAKKSPSAASETRVIKSPFVGTFYRSPGPGKPVFVEIGSIVKSGDALCILEAMKLMNEIEAEFKCKIVKILVDDSSPVEYGEALFEVEPL
jgi:acetyl-CoA carboxylase biotin carboxyl carrier protein